MVWPNVSKQRKSNQTVSQTKIEAGIMSKMSKCQLKICDEIFQF